MAGWYHWVELIDGYLSIYNFSIRKSDIPDMVDMSGELLLTYESLLKDLYTLSKSADFAKCRPHTTRSFYKRATFTGVAPVGLPSSFFNAAWYASLNEAARRDLHVAAREFQWIDITTERSV